MMFIQDETAEALGRALKLEGYHRLAYLRSLVRNGFENTRNKHELWLVQLMRARLMTHASHNNAIRSGVVVHSVQRPVIVSGFFGRLSVNPSPSFKGMNDLVAAS